MLRTKAMDMDVDSATAPSFGITVQEINSPIGTFSNIILPKKEKESNNETQVTFQAPHVIVVMDRSGSMTGPRVAAAKKSVLKIMDLMHDVTVIAFHSQAYLVESDKVSSITAGGGTCFRNAFELMIQNMKSSGDTVIILITDGETDAADVDQSITLLRRKIDKDNSHRSVICHALGISQESTIHLLSQLADSGTVVGTVQHIPGAEDIDESVKTLIDIILAPGDTIPIRTTDGRWIRNNIITGKAPETLLVNRKVEQVVKLPVLELVEADADTVYRVILTAIQEIARDLRKDRDTVGAEKRLAATEDLIKSMAILNQEEKISLLRDVATVTDSIKKLKKDDVASVGNGGFFDVRMAARLERNRLQLVGAMGRSTASTGDGQLQELTPCNSMGSMPNNAVRGLDNVIYSARQMRWFRTKK